MNPKSSLEEKQASRGATRNIWQHASPDDCPRAKSQLKYTYIFAHRFSGFAGRQLTSRRVINIKAGTSFHHYRRHLSWYKYGYNRYTVIRVKSRILTGLTFYNLLSTMNTKFSSSFCSRYWIIRMLILTFFGLLFKIRF